MLIRLLVLIPVICLVSYFSGYVLADLINPTCIENNLEILFITYVIGTLVGLSSAFVEDKITGRGRDASSDRWS